MIKGKMSDPQKNKKGILYRTRVYLSGQMQYFDGEPWRVKVGKEFEKRGIIVFSPYNHPFIGCTQENSDVAEYIKTLIAQNKYDEVAALVKKVRVEDLRTVDIADFIFCYLNPKYPTVGTWEEVFWANRMKKPIFFVVEGGKAKCPFWMYGVIPHKYIYDSIGDALKMVLDIDDGVKPIDSARWRLLKTEYR